MRHSAESGFLLKAAEIRRDIFVPRYYDPRIAADLSSLSKSYHLISIDELVATSQLLHDHGNYVPKIHYGTGPYPYVRTSDLANWEIRASPKHGVPLDVFEDYQARQDVKSCDVLFVHEGTYLIGSCAMVTPFDGPMLYQHHLAKFRVLPAATFDAFYFLSALASPIVRRQIRARQFSADIIDSVVGRLGEVILPIPKDVRRLRKTQEVVRDAIIGRARIREQLSFFVRELDHWLANKSGTNTLDSLIKWAPKESEYEGTLAFLGGRGQFIAFSQPSRKLVSDILIPKYYDPTLPRDARRYASRCNLATIAELEQEGIVSIATGDEIGRLSYGSGRIPFIRTSDLASYELNADSKHGISQEIADSFAERQDVSIGDILVVRDGTYLVGSSSLVFEEDLPLVYCGGLVKIRTNDHSKLPPGLLYGLLNTPFLRKQMRSKQFTRDVIDTLGRRLREVVLPLPKEQATRNHIAEYVSDLCSTRVKLRTSLDNVIARLFPV